MDTAVETVKRVSIPAVLGWVGLAILLSIAGFSAIAGLNKTVYSASAFVDEYLSSIGNDNITETLALPGVMPGTDELEERGLPTNVSTALLRPGVIEEGPSDVRIVRETTEADGTHTVTASFRLGETILEQNFTLEPLDPMYGLFSRWEFASSPLATIDVTVAHGALFTVGALTLDTRAVKPEEELANFSQTTPYLALSPAIYELEYSSTLLTALPAQVDVSGSDRFPVTVDLQPTDAFVEQVQTELNRYLTEDCASQQVLQPGGCPFGIYVDDRIESSPVWTITEFPTVVLTPGDSSFDMATTPGVAHVEVEVRSLFDGSRFTLSEDASFSITLGATIQPDGKISIELR